MTIAELKKEKILLRKTDELRATAYGMLINGAEQIAIKERRTVSDADIAASAKTMKNQLEATILEYEACGADTSTLKAERDIYAAFLPKGMPEEEVRRHVKEFLAALSDEEKESKGKLKGALKQKVPGIDMALASKILDELL